MIYWCYMKCLLVLQHHTQCLKSNLTFSFSLNISTSEIQKMHLYPDTHIQSTLLRADFCMYMLGWGVCGVTVALPCSLNIVSQMIFGGSKWQTCKDWWWENTERQEVVVLVRLWKNLKINLEKIASINKRQNKNNKNLLKQWSTRFIRHQIILWICSTSLDHSLITAFQQTTNHPI